jgi:hypothetical protein
MGRIPPLAAAAGLSSISPFSVYVDFVIISPLESSLSLVVEESVIVYSL